MGARVYLKLGWYGYYYVESHDGMIWLVSNDDDNAADDDDDDEEERKRGIYKTRNAMQCRCIIYHHHA